MAVIAPSGPALPDRIDRGLTWLRSVGLDPVESASLRENGGHGLPFLAGTDSQRASDLVDAWFDPEVAAILCVRGGDGTPRYVDDLPWDRMAEAGSKIVAGLSDITALHQTLGRRLGVASLWAPMPGTSVIAGTGDHSGDEWSKRGLANALMKQPDEEILHLQGAASQPGEVTAPLVGGTVSLLAAMAGTESVLPADGAIAILEDVDEHPYRIERFLTQLRRSGFFDGAVGIACGDFIRCGDPQVLRRVLDDRLGDLGIPVVHDLPFGHGERQASLWLGRPARIDGEQGTLTQQLPA